MRNPLPKSWWICAQPPRLALPPQQRPNLLFLPQSKPLSLPPMRGQLPLPGNPPLGGLPGHLSCRARQRLAALPCEPQAPSLFPRLPREHRPRRSRWMPPARSRRQRYREHQAYWAQRRTARPAASTPRSRRSRWRVLRWRRKRPPQLPQPIFRQRRWKGLCPAWRMLLRQLPLHRLPNFPPRPPRPPRGGLLRLK